MQRFVFFANCVVLSVFASTIEAFANSLADDAVDDETVLFQRNIGAIVKSAASAPTVVEEELAGSDRWPILVPLRRELVPVLRNGKAISFKTSYSGEISLGLPAQDFRVVFDTGSGHVVVPSSACASESCVVHKRYNISASSTSTAINVDGSPVDSEDLGDQATIGYGTGKVTGEFASERLCVGHSDSGQAGACVEVGVVMAVEMTTQPFKSFNFDGILGMSLDGLAVSPEFSFVSRLAGGGLGAAAQFAVFLAGGDESDELKSEIALGGYNADRLMSPLSWVPVAKKEMGYWQVQIKEVRIGNVTLDMCKDGSCRGIVDTGTSHLGVPSKRFKDFTSALAMERVEGKDCRDLDGPSVELVVEGFTLSLTPKNYMRSLAPIHTAHSSASEGAAQDHADAQAPLLSQHAGEAVSKAPALGGEHLKCAPRIMPVNFPEPLGPNIFILGEPVLSRYYTVFNWHQPPQIGFGLAANPQNLPASTVGEVTEEPGHDDLEAFMEVSLMQVSLTVSVSYRGGGRGAGAVPRVSGLADIGDTALPSPPQLPSSAAFDGTGELEDPFFGVSSLSL